MPMHIFSYIHKIQHICMNVYYRYSSNLTLYIYILHTLIHIPTWGTLLEK